jgi:hypothetical protein
MSHDEEEDLTVLPMSGAPGFFDASARATEPIVDPGAAPVAASTRRPGLGVATPASSPPPAAEGATAVTPKAAKLWFSPGCPPNTCPACHRKQGGNLTVGQHSRGRDGLACELLPEERRGGAKRQKRAVAGASGEVDGGAAVAIAGVEAVTGAAADAALAP